MITLLAQNEQGLGWVLNGLGPLGDVSKLTTASDVGDRFNLVVSFIIGFLTILGGLFFVFVFITGALSWLSAGGDKMATENAQKRITSGLIGLVIIVTGIFIIDILGKLLGLDILNPGGSVLKLKP